MNAQETFIEQRDDPPTEESVVSALFVRTPILAYETL